MPPGIDVERKCPALAGNASTLGGYRKPLEPPTPLKGIQRRTSAGPRLRAPAPPASAPDLPPIAAKADDLEAIKKAVEDAAAISGALWFSYLFALFYFAVAAGTVTHEDLFFERAVKLPFLGIDFAAACVLFLGADPICCGARLHTYASGHAG
jgi:hypothetical protein